MAEQKTGAVQGFLQRHPNIQDVVETHPNKPWWQSKRTYMSAATVLAGLGTVISLVAGGSKTLTIVAGVCTAVAGILRTLLGKQDSENKVVYPQFITPLTDKAQEMEATLWRK